MTSRYNWPLDEQAIEQLRHKKAILVLAPRAMSRQRIIELLKPYIRRGQVIFGIANEEYVVDFEGQLQFTTLTADTVSDIADQINRNLSPGRISLICYPQAETDELIRAIRPNFVVVVRGSYSRSFHRRETYKLLKKRGIGYELVSPFVDETEALDYLTNTLPLLPDTQIVSGDELTMLDQAERMAKRSFDYSMQVGAVIAEKVDQSYKVVDSACNEVVPYQTYALYAGSTREDNKAGLHDAFHYDTIHAEMNLLVRSSQKNQSLAGKSLFVNLMCCPNCARVLCRTGLKEVVYSELHSGDYSRDLFEKSNIKVRRISP